VAWSDTSAGHRCSGTLVDAVGLEQRCRWLQAAWERRMRLAGRFLVENSGLSKNGSVF
jgi:hypothetical protein